MDNKEIRQLYQLVLKSENSERAKKEVLDLVTEKLAFLEDQEERNRIVNRVAAVIKEELGSIQDEIAKTLELVRTVHPRTVQKQKAKEKENKTKNA